MLMLRFFSIAALATSVLGFQAPNMPAANLDRMALNVRERSWW